MSRVLVDNWTLQNVDELFSDGFGTDEIATIEIDKEKTRHKYKTIPYGIIRIEGLFDILNDIVLRDELTVDEKFISAWARPDGPLIRLQENGIITGFPFLTSPEKLKAPTEALVQKLCVTPTLATEHDSNSKMWAKEGRVVHQLLSTVLWGGAGMLARSHVYECNYMPHPLRRRLLQRSGIYIDRADASGQLHELIRKKRLQLLQRTSDATSLYSAFISLPPIPLRVIEESASLMDVFVVALQIRDELKELRQWLNQFQNALDNEDIKEVNKHVKLLESVSQHTDQVISGSAGNRVDMSLNLGLFKFAIKNDPLLSFQNKIGVRSTINKLIFDKPGKQALKKLLRLLGEENSTAGFKAYEHFRTQ